MEGDVFFLKTGRKSPDSICRHRMAYLAGTDSAITKRAWQNVMDDIIIDKQGPTLRHWGTAIRDLAFKSIRNRLVIETLPEDLSTGFTLRQGQHARLSAVIAKSLSGHELAAGQILPKKLFPKIVHGEKQAITWGEHCQIVACERNPERRNFYELCWHLGGSQSDVAALKAEDFHCILDYRVTLNSPCSCRRTKSARGHRIERNGA